MKRMLSVLLLAVCATIVCAKEPKRPTSYNYQRGIEAITNGDNEEGEKYLLEELKENPKNGYAYAWLSSIENDREELGNVISLLNLALKHLPKSDKYYIAWSYSSLGKTYLELNDTVQALECINAAVKTEPTNTDWLEDRGVMYLIIKQYDKAIADFNKIIQLSPGNIQGYLLTARVHFEREEYSEAMKLYKHANLLSEHSYIYSYMAMAENQLQNYEQAADYVIEALKAERFEEIAMDLISIENPELLEELLPRIKIQIAKYPNAIDWKFYLIAIHRINKHYEEAINLTQEVKTLDSDPYYDYVISDLYRDLGDYKTALVYAQKACEADTSDSQYQYNKLYIYEELGQMDEAFSIANELIKQTPDESSPYLTRADLYFKIQEYTKAIEDYNTAIAIRPQHHYARFKRGYAYLLINDSSKSRKDFQRLVQDAEGEIEQAFAFLHLGQIDKSRSLADSLLKSDSIYHSERYNVACIYSLLGETELAFATLEEELKDGYNHFNHIRNDVDLQNLHGERLDKLIYKYEEQAKQRARAFQNDTCQTINEERIVEVPFAAAGGVTKVDCTINDLPLNFIFDTGASDVTISKVEADFMYKNGYLTERDIVGKKSYQVATGAIAVGTTIILKEIKFGGLVLNDVRASVVESQNAPLLLGQSVLKRLGKIEIDNVKRVLKITTNQ